MAQRGRPRNIVFDKVTGKGMTINQFTKRSAVETRRLCLTRSEIVKRKVLTKKELDEAIKKGDLREKFIANKNYISRIELAAFISKVRKNS